MLTHPDTQAESANSNFFDSIPLLLGAWQVLLGLQLLLATVRVDRLLAGKAVDG